MGKYPTVNPVIAPMAFPAYSHAMRVAPRPRMSERIHPDKEFEGTGVGLTIVRKAVERMGAQGRLRVGIGQRRKGKYLR